MSASNPRFCFRQRGFTTAMAAIFLIAAVIFALTQTLEITGSNSIDNAQQLDSTAALYLAESGIERAKGILAESVSSGSLTNTSCTNIATGGSFTLGRGSFKYGSAIPLCGSDGSCTKCTFEVTGTVGSASRTLKYGVNLVPPNGISGFGTNVSISLKNNYAVPASVIFELAWRRQDGGGKNAEASICSGCGLKWYVESSSGIPSAGAMGSAYENIAAGATSPPLTQTISFPRSYAEVGAYFPGLTIDGVSTAPKILGSYWDRGTGGNNNRTFKSSNSNPSIGETNSGVVNAGVCLIPEANTNNNGLEKQTCTSWCYGTNNNADTLVFGVSAKSDTAIEKITAVHFNTNGSPAQNIAMTPIAQFSNNATGDIYAEIWKTYNPAYPPQSTGPGATSFSKAVYGTIGANITGTIGSVASSAVGASFTGDAGSKKVSTITVSNTLTVKNGSMCTNCTLSKNDVITGGVNSSNAPTNTTVTNVSGNTITVNPAIYAASSNFTSASPCLNVASVTSGVVNIGDIVVIGTSPTINALGGSSCTPVTGITTYLLSAFNRGSPTDIKSTKLIASAAPTYGRLIVGDSITVTNTVNGTPTPTTTTISSLNSLNGLTAGTYTLSSAVGPSSGTLTLSSSNLVINNATGSNLVDNNYKTANDFNFVAALYKGDGATLVGANVTGARTKVTTVSPNYEYYPLSAAKPPPTNVPGGIVAAQWFTQGTSGTAITLPTGTTVPTFDTTLAVYSGTGVLNTTAKTKVLASPTPTATAFSVSAAPSTPLNGAQLCGGICALFNNPASISSVTQFQVTDTSTNSFNRWAGGFTCLSGVNDTLIKPVTGKATLTSDWSELVK